MSKKHLRDLSIRLACNTEEEANMIEKEFFYLRGRLRKKLKRNLSYELIFLIKETGKFKVVVSKHK